MPSTRSLRILVLCAAVSLGCSSDPTSANQPVFPSLSSTVLSTYCVQGQKLPGQAIAGMVATTNCDTGDYGGGRTYFVVWHIRVATTGSYRFTASSTFDNVLTVYHLDSYTATTAGLTAIGSDDDSGGNGNALLNVSLTAGQDYFLKVIGWEDGFDMTGKGPYTATFTGPF